MYRNVNSDEIGRLLPNQKIREFVVENPLAMMPVYAFEFSNSCGLFHTPFNASKFADVVFSGRCTHHKSLFGA